jgi:hypothetical protein
MQLDTIQQTIATLPPDAQQIIFDLISILKKRYSNQSEDAPEAESQPQIDNHSAWSDFIGCVEAEPDLSKNHKNYLSQELAKKYDHC